MLLYSNSIRSSTTNDSWNMKKGLYGLGEGRESKALWPERFRASAGHLISIGSVLSILERISGVG